jgi:hypothetical protein
MAKTPQEVGKEFEEDFRLLCKGISSRHRAAVHRLYDAHSAGGYMPEQPGDFFFLMEQHLHLFELKSSHTHQTLVSGLSSLMNTSQAAQLRFWARAGAVTHVLFLSQQDGAIELWSGEHVAMVRASYRGRLKPEGIVMRFKSFKEFKTVFEAALISNPRFSAAGV